MQNHIFRQISLVCQRILLLQFIVNIFYLRNFDISSDTFGLLEIVVQKLTIILIDSGDFTVVPLRLTLKGPMYFCSKMLSLVLIGQILFGVHDLLDFLQNFSTFFLFFRFFVFGYILLYFLGLRVLYRIIWIKFVVLGLRWIFVDDHFDFRVQLNSTAVLRILKRILNFSQTILQLFFVCFNQFTTQKRENIFELL